MNAAGPGTIWIARLHTWAPWLLSITLLQCSDGETAQQSAATPDGSVRASSGGVNGSGNGGARSGGASATGGAPAAGGATRSGGAGGTTEMNDGGVRTGGRSGVSDASADGPGPDSAPDNAVPDARRTDAGDARAPSVCGDGLVEPPEMCEPNEADCRSDCTFAPGHIFWTDIVVGANAAAGGRGYGAAFDVFGSPFAAFELGGSAGGAYMKKYTRSGQQVWFEPWGSPTFAFAYSLVARRSGDIVIGGTTNNDLFYGRMTAAGVQDWGGTVASADGEIGSLLALPDDSVIAVGEVLVPGTSETRAWIGKISPGGIVAWDRTIGAGPRRGQFRDARILRDGRIVAFGCCSDTGEWMLETFNAATGAATMLVELPGLGDIVFLEGAMTVDRHGDIVMAWQTTADKYWMAKYDDTGQEVWTLPPTSTLDPVHATAIVATPQDTYVVGGHVPGTDLYADGWYGVFDRSGNPLRSGGVTGPGSNMVRDVAVDDRGVVLLTGETTTTALAGWVRMLAP